MSNPIRLSANLTDRVAALLQGRFGNFPVQGNLRALVRQIMMTPTSLETLDAVQSEAENIVSQAELETFENSQALKPILTAISVYKSLNHAAMERRYLQRQRGAMALDDSRLASIDTQIESLERMATAYTERAQRADAELQNLAAALQGQEPSEPAQAPSQPVAAPTLQPVARATFAEINQIAPIAQLDPLDEIDPQTMVQVNNWLEYNAVDGIFNMPPTESMDDLNNAGSYITSMLRAGAGQVQALRMRSFNYLIPHIHAVSDGLNIANAMLYTNFEGSRGFEVSLRAILERVIGNVELPDGTLQVIDIADIFPVNRQVPFARTDFAQYYQRILNDQAFSAIHRRNARAMVAEIFLATRQIIELLGQLHAAYQASLTPEQFDLPWYRPPRSDDGSDQDGTGPAATTVPASDTPEQEASQTKSVQHDDAKSDVSAEDEIVPDPDPFEQEPQPFMKRSQSTSSLSRMKSKFLRGWNTRLSKMMPDFGDKNAPKRSYSTDDVSRFDETQFEGSEVPDWSKTTDQTSPESSSGPSKQPGEKHRKIKIGLPFVRTGTKTAPSGPEDSDDDKKDKDKKPSKPGGPTGPRDPQDPKRPSDVTHPSDQASRNIGPYQPWTGLPIENLSGDYDVNKKNPPSNKSLEELRVEFSNQNASDDKAAYENAKDAYSKALTSAMAQQSQQPETMGKFGFDDPKTGGASLNPKDRYRFQEVKSAFNTLEVKKPKLRPDYVKTQRDRISSDYRKKLGKDEYYQLRINNMVAGGAQIGKTMSAPRQEVLTNFYDYLFDSQTAGVHVLIQDHEFDVDLSVGVPMVRYFEPIPSNHGSRLRIIQQGEPEESTGGFPPGTVIVPKGGIKTTKGRMKIECRTLSEHYLDDASAGVLGQESARSTIHELILTRDGHERRIKVIHTKGWREDHKKANSGDVDKLLKLRKETFGSENLSKVITHSKAGAGRSGVMLAAEASLNLGLPMLTVVSDLRGSRNRLMVHAPEANEILINWAQSRELPILPTEARALLADEHGDFGAVGGTPLSPAQLPQGQRRPSFRVEQQQESDTEDEIQPS